MKAAAVELGLPVTHDIDDLLTTDVDLGVVVAYGRIIKPHVLVVLPMVNVHFSLLPRWRGAAPVERAILAGDATTGVCIMDVEETLDTGGIYACREVPLGAATTATELRSTLVQLGTELLVDVLSSPLPTPQPQTGEVTYAEKLSPDELQLRWARPAIELDRVVRVGGAWTTFRGRRLKVHRASVGTDGGGVFGTLGPDGIVTTGAGTLRLLQVQPEGKGVLSWADFANGARPQPGESLGD